MANEGRLYGRRVGLEVIKALGGRPTPEKLRFFEAWARAEGTKAQYNPFATTKKGYPGETSFNQVGVKNYPDLQTGIQATVDTLKLDYYTNIVKLLRSKDATAEQLAKAVASSPWGTGSGVLRVLGASDVDGYEQAYHTAQYSVRKAQLKEQHTITSFQPSQTYLDMMNRASPVMGQIAQGAAQFGKFLEDLPGGTEVTPTETSYQFKPGKVIFPGTSWKGTHVTDNLGWGTRTATDIMADPGTPVGAPEAGTIVRHGSAQGGSSLYFQGVSGTEYWLGHIDNMLAVGTKVKRGQPIAVVSSDHANPHLHIDRRQVDMRKGKGKGKK